MSAKAAKAPGRGAGSGRKAAPAAPSPLHDYRRKRDFALTPEPAGRPRRGSGDAAGQARQFVVQKHAARQLHYDFRLELDGSLKSWAVPKGPSLDPKLKRLAVQVEDHPLDYAGFEGRIPAGQYGGGDVIVWDRGVWQADDSDPAAAYRAGKLKFHLCGDKLSGGWTLVRTRLPGSAGRPQWLLIKENDAAARAAADYDILAARPESVLSHAPLPGARGRAPTEPRAAAAERPAGGRPAALPRQLAPELATPVDAPPAGDWRYEIKFDGYRLLARVDGAAVRLITRSGLDWTARLEPLAAALRALELEAAWLDGELVALDRQGLPDFQTLQNAFDAGQSGELVYYLFDLPYHAGLDLRRSPLEQRRDLLRRLLERGDRERLRYSEDFAAGHGDILRSACALKLEGVIGKRAGSPYVSRRSTDWIKLKCRLRQEFVIGGHSAPQGRRSGFGALLLGVHDEGRALRYAGRVGAGFSEASLRLLHGQMQPLARPTPPFVPPPAGRDAAGVTWLEPRLVCEVEFASWTRDGLVRQAVFHGLRDDKPAAAVVRERAVPAARLAPPPAAGRPAGGRAEVAGIAISHPERVIDAASGLSKLGLAEFYRDLAPQLLPQLAGRPLSLLRAPDGVAGGQFFQRHAESLAIPGLRQVPGPGADDAALMVIDSLPALIGAVQMGGIEFHTWNAGALQLDRPDRLVFDLDPDPALPWGRIAEATRLLLTLLDELGLAAFLKTSGGKGMHVVVPLVPGADWKMTKAFSKAVAQHLARLLPQRFADKMGAPNRVGRIFVDYLRNQPGASTVAAYSVRARPGLPVSVPIARDEVERIGGAAAWTVGNLAERLASLAGDPWAGYADGARRITPTMRRRLGMTA